MHWRATRRVLLSALCLSGSVACRVTDSEPSAPVGAVVYMADSIATAGRPLILEDNAVVRVSLYHDAVYFGENLQAGRSANLLQINKATRDTLLLQPTHQTVFVRTGNEVRIKSDVACVGTITYCPEFETGRFVGNTLYLTSRYAGFQTIRYVRTVLAD